MRVLYRVGSRGEMVRAIQKALKVYPDGIFGPLTEEAVRVFQAENGLTVDGIVGAATLSSLFASKVTDTLSLTKSQRRIDEIIVHCTATPEGKDVTVEQIRNDHVRNRGFSDIGYHYVITLDGDIVDGRDVDIAGAHCTDHNAHSIGVSYVGGLTNYPGLPYNKQHGKDTRTEEQRRSLRLLLEHLRKLYPAARIIGHRDTSPDTNGNGTVEPFEWIKECPSFDAKKEYSYI